MSACSTPLCQRSSAAPTATTHAATCGAPPFPVPATSAPAQGLSSTGGGGGGGADDDDDDDDDDDNDDDDDDDDG